MKEEDNMLVPKSPSDNSKFTRVAKPIRITDILVSQKKGMGEFDQANKYATTGNYLKRIKHQMGLHAAIANAEHESMNFERDPSNHSRLIMKQGMENEIVRLTSNEFFFYPSHDATKGKPLSQKEFQEIVDEAIKIGESCHENLHLVFASFPVEGPDNQIYNMVVHVQCGNNPVVNTFAKSTSSDQDASYPDKENRNFVLNSHVPEILVNEIEFDRTKKTLDEVIEYVSRNGLNADDIRAKNVGGWLQTTLSIIESDNYYPIPETLRTHLKYLHGRTTINKPFTEEEIAIFKKEMYAYKQQIIAVIGRVDVPSNAKTLDEIVVEIEKNLASRNTRDIALQQLSYLENNLILPTDDVLTNINKIRTGIMISNSINNYYASLDNIIDSIVEGKTVDSKTYQQFKDGYSTLRNLLKETYKKENMSPNAINEELKKFDAGLEQIFQKIELQQSIAKFDAKLQALIDSVNKEDYQGSEKDKERIKYNAKELTKALIVLMEDLRQIDNINKADLIKYSLIFEIQLKKISDGKFIESDFDLFQDAVEKLNSVLNEVKQSNKLNRDDAEKLIVARGRDQAIRKIERIGGELRNTDSLKESIEKYQKETVSDKLADNIVYSSQKELAQLAKEYQVLREDFEKYKLQELSKIGNDEAAKNQRLVELLTEHRVQLTPLLHQIKRKAEFTNTSDIESNVDVIIGSPEVTEQLFNNFDGVVKSIQVEEETRLKKTRSTAEMIKFLNFVKSIDGLNGEAKQAVADLIKHLQEGTLGLQDVVKFQEDIKPYADKIKNELKYWSFPDQSFNKGFNYNSTIKCKSAGGTEFYTALEVCLDHLYEIAKHNLDKTITSSSDVSPLLISHLITANTVARQTNKFFTPFVTHADRNNTEMSVYDTRNHSRLPSVDFSPSTKNVRVRSEYGTPQIKSRDNKLIIEDPYFGPSELEFYKSAPHILAPIALNGSERSKDTYTREYYINKIEKLVLMARDHVCTREQHDEMSQFMTKLTELKSDQTLTGRKLLAELNNFKDKIGKLDNSHLLVQQIEQIESFIYKKFLSPEECEKQVVKDNCVRAVKNILADPNLEKLPQVQTDLITDLVKDLTVLSKMPDSTGYDFIQKVSEYKANADSLINEQDMTILNIKLETIEEDIYERLLPNEYKAKYIDTVYIPPKYDLRH